MAKRKKRPCRFHHFIYRFLKVVVRPIIYLKMAFVPKRAALSATPSLIYANHTCDADPILVGLGIRAHMYYVASSHIVHKGWGPIIMRLFDPILRVKGRTETDATMDILRRLRSGDNVCIFIEGECSYDGKTSYIAPSAAHLAKISGVPLVTYRTTGGYFTGPRWSSSWRKGHLSGEVVAEYPASELKALPSEELQAIIERDLYVDAYAEQEKQKIAFKGKNLAEHLETALFICPLCQRLASLHSQGDFLTCECGLRLRYNEYGWFENAGTTAMPYDTIRDWFAWQKQKIKEICQEAQNDTASDTALTRDSRQEFYVYGEHGKELEAVGTLALYANRLEIGFDGQELEKVPLEQVKSFSCLQQRTIVLTLADGRLYEIGSPYPRSAVKYQLFFGFIKVGSPN